MYFLGFSINNFTLLALTIAIGIVVDDAIIVLENAFRHQEELHEEPEQAAVNGTNEIGFAVVATTIALVAVFTPLAFLTGTAGRLLSEFGIAVAGAVVISGFVALTLTRCSAPRSCGCSTSTARPSRSSSAASTRYRNGMGSCCAAPSITARPSCSVPWQSSPSPSSRL